MLRLVNIIWVVVKTISDWVVKDRDILEQVWHFYNKGPFRALFLCPFAYLSITAEWRIMGI